MERKYLPTTAQLIDRLCIVTLKSIKIPDHKKEYEEEASLIISDLNALLGDNKGNFIRAIQINAIANETIWANESKAREGSDEQNDLLQFTHSINGIRTAAMNQISNLLNERKDLKVDCLASGACQSRGYDFRGLLDG